MYNNIIIDRCQIAFNIRISLISSAYSLVSKVSNGTNAVPKEEECWHVSLSQADLPDLLLHPSSKFHVVEKFCVTLPTGEKINSTGLITGQCVSMAAAHVGWLKASVSGRLTAFKRPHRLSTTTHTTVTTRSLRRVVVTAEHASHQTPKTSLSFSVCTQRTAPCGKRCGGFHETVFV